MKKRAIINFIASVGYQVLTMLVGLLIPKFYTEIFGSVYNGLNSSATQIMRLLHVLTLGISAVSIQQTIKYLAGNDTEMATSIYHDTGKQYRKMGLIFPCIMLPIIVVFPFVVKDDLSYWVIAAFLLFHSISAALEYFFQAKFNAFLTAANESYVVYVINIIVLMVLSGLHLLVLFTFKNIILYQALAVFTSLLRYIIISVYVYRKYPYLKNKPKKKYTPPKDGKRKDVLIAEVSDMIINSTDLIVLSSTVGLVFASIYAVYNYVVTGLGNVLSSCREAVFGGIGKSYFTDFDDYKNKMNRFESVYLFLVFFLYSTCIVLFRPFIEAYTAKMDADYVATFFPILFVLAKLVVNIRIPAIVAVNTAGHFKQVKMYAVVEAIINLTVSLSLVYFIGIYGVLIGTVAGALYRTPLLVNYANKAIIKRSSKEYWFKILKWLPIFAGCFVFSLFMPFHCGSLSKWIVFTLIVTPIILVLCLGWTWLTDRTTLKEIKSTLKRLFRKKGQA